MAGLQPAFCFSARHVRVGSDEYTGLMPATMRLSEPPRLLALDSASEQLAVAVVVGDQQWVAKEAGGPRASPRLLPRVFELLAAARLAPDALDAIAFGRGPGAFTGLRSACSVAQGLALGLGCPVLALDSLAIWAEDVYAQHGVSDVWVAVDARMDDAYAAPYRRDGALWSALRPPAILTSDSSSSSRASPAESACPFTDASPRATCT